MKLHMTVLPEPITATGATLGVHDEEREGMQIATLDVFSIKPPSGNRLFDDGDREYVRELAKRIAARFND